MKKSSSSIKKLNIIPQSFMLSFFVVTLSLSMLFPGKIMATCVLPITDYNQETKVLLISIAACQPEREYRVQILNSDYILVNERALSNLVGGVGSNEEFSISNPGQYHVRVVRADNSIVASSQFTVAETASANDPTPNSDTNIVSEPVTADRIKELNPLSFLGANQDLHTDGKLNIAGLINRALTFIFPLAGLALFLMLVWGGFEMLTGAASKKSLDAGKQRITAAIIGFLLLFSSYWIVQIVEQITGVGILG